MIKLFTRKACVPYKSEDEKIVIGALSKYYVGFGTTMDMPARRGYKILMFRYKITDTKKLYNECMKVANPYIFLYN